MKVFTCQACQQLIFFENVQCVRCGHVLGYLPEVGALSALEAEGGDQWRALAPQAQSRHYRMCRNYSQENVCNWLLGADDEETLCLSCRLNQVTPDLSSPETLTYWQRIEAAKRRLIYGLLGLGLPLLNKQQDPERGLAFAFPAGPGHPQENSTVMTGHAHGVITLNIAEADDAVREQTRLRMNESYRTLLGHFRHESGHYYWEQLIHPSAHLETFRELFGDDRADYDQVLQAYYKNGPPPDWQEHFVSAYASAHPWEDWAETWAHYLHIVDTLETARHFNLHVKTPGGAAGESTLKPDDAMEYRPASFEAMMESWFPLTYAINNINRSMGQPDMYPFVLSPKAIEKLRFVHKTISDAAHCSPQTSG